MNGYCRSVDQWSNGEMEWFLLERGIMVFDVESRGVLELLVRSQMTILLQESGWISA